MLDGARSIPHSGVVVLPLTPAPDPLTTVERLRQLPNLLFLDSASDPDRLGRYSFLTADPDVLVVGDEGGTTVVTPDGRGVTRTSDDPLLVARGLLAPPAPMSMPPLPPFVG